MTSTSVSPSPVSSLPLAPISLAGRAGHRFEPAIMLQGFACHARGVELYEATPKAIRARVRSKRLHDVELHARAGRLIVACSCAARSFGQTVCKHVWAALLEVDRRGGLEELHAIRGVLAVDAAPPAKAAGEDPGTHRATKPADPPPAPRRADRRGKPPPTKHTETKRKEPAKAAASTAPAKAAASTAPAKAAASSARRSKAGPRPSAKRTSA